MTPFNNSSDDRMNDILKTSKDTCITFQTFVLHPVYRVSQIYQFLVLMLAVFPLSYFIFFKMIKSSFHKNLKWTLIGYFGSIFVFTLAFQVMGFIHVLLPFISTNPCDLIIGSEYLKIGHPIGSFLMTLSTIFPITITIERFIAMKTAESYENARIILGPALVLIMIFGDLMVILWVYKDENFDYEAVSFMIFPSSVASKMFMFFFIILLLNAINLLFNLFLFRENNRLKKKSSSLATKYQLEEVYFSTKFVISIVFAHVTFFAFYLLSMILSGLIGKRFIENPIDQWALSGVLMSMIATYNFLIGIISIHLYNKIRAKKTIDINGNIQMKSTGKAGALNYDNAIASIWNSAPSSTRRTTV